MTLGKNIKEHRNRLGFSQEKIAALVNVSRQAVTKWEADQSIPCMENLFTLTEIFGISLNELRGKVINEQIKLRPVKNSWKTYCKYTLALGAVLLAATVILYAIAWISSDYHGLEGWPLALGINGVVWFVLGIIFTMFYRHQNNKLQRLKKDGFCYDARLNRIIRSHTGMRIGSLLSGYAVCDYCNQQGETHTVKSNSFILDEHHAEYKIFVFVNPSNPSDYAVEVNMC